LFSLQVSMLNICRYYNFSPSILLSLSLSLSLFLSLSRWDFTLAKQTLEPHLQSILLRLFWRWGLMNYLPGLVSSHNPPDLSFPSS
jgi:hypothetical protein